MSGRDGSFMTFIAYLPLLIAVLGLLLWLALAGFTKANFSEVGKIAYAAGLLAFLLGAGAVVESCSAGTSGAPVHEHH